MGTWDIVEAAQYMDHIEVPHAKGYLVGCEGCEFKCHCNPEDAYAAPCIYCDK